MIATTKVFDSGGRAPAVQWQCPIPGDPHRSKTMSEKTCAACDYPLDENAIQVRVGGKTVEVCCEDCAVKLREAYASATASQQASVAETAKAAMD